MLFCTYPPGVPILLFQFDWPSLPFDLAGGEELYTVTIISSFLDYDGCEQLYEQF